MSSKFEDFIPLIHNYCDRWCDRCDFTSRCSVFSKETIAESDPNISQKDFLAQLEANFAETKEILRQLTQDIGLDLSTLEDKEFAQYLQGEEDFVNTHSLTLLAEGYDRNTKEVLNNKDQWLIFSVADKNTQDELLETISWYQPFILSKVKRGLSGILDFDGNEISEEIYNSQSDANGSIKVGLIAVERSVSSWAALMTNENALQIQPLITQLKTIKEQIEIFFPKASDFNRPGFDEVEMELVM